MTMHEPDNPGSPKFTILIVDDERDTREGLKRALRGRYEVITAESAERALDILEENSVDLVLTDLRMPGLGGMDFLARLKAREDAPVCMMLTAYGSVETAVEAMKRGAYDYLTKPVDLDRLDVLLDRALASRKLERENRNLRYQLNQEVGLQRIIGRSPEMQRVFDLIRAVAPSRASVLIEGESGTGKELVAHAVHQLSMRSEGPYVAVHCAALTETLLESELFGHEKGSFTGAHERRKGRFEMADGGTLFLDEISEIAPGIQVKILRVLEERAFERVGGQKTVEVDVRLVTATNRDLEEMVQLGDFREDLYYRLNVVRIKVPPLRERTGDLPLLIQHFLLQFSEENGKKYDGLTPEAMDVLQAYTWPGNVRQLRNCIEHMVVLGTPPYLGVGNIPDDIRKEVEEPQAGSSEKMKANPESDHRVAQDSSSSNGVVSLDQAEKELIIKALDETGGNRTAAARKLGISRRTLHRKLKAYELEGV
jgi:DNA-binding NtrC family response regulator